MKKNRHTTDQSIEKLRQADVALGKGQQHLWIFKAALDEATNNQKLAQDINAG